MEESCIVRHFSTYTDLGNEEKDLLVSLERCPTFIPRGTTIWDEGDPARSFYTVRRGWLYTTRHMEDGTRQVLDILVPGDIAGLREFAFQGRLTGLTALTDVEICPFPKYRLNEVFNESLLLSNLFFAMATREQAVLLERLVNLGRRTAKQKMAHFLLEMYIRLQRTGAVTENRFQLPMSQYLLGDTLGLSAVHVSRTLTELREANLLRRQGARVWIEDLEQLKAVAGFNADYLREDFDSLVRAVHVREQSLDSA